MDKDDQKIPRDITSRIQPGGNATGKKKHSISSYINYNEKEGLTDFDWGNLLN